jgi:hypothetical protein
LAEDGDRWREVKTAKLLETLLFQIDGEWWRMSKTDTPSASSELVRPGYLPHRVEPEQLRQAGH